ncbi:zinc finger MYM-type protein 1-like [Bufo bufo]|uniref:zinc finger MYM-type protein 1-like n=1 Tax=Bufo bufo TaxID=8384 RepID=UPI001ABDECDA|nr:zinc finger MYM-type protein 1-like [Bufo bufo]
MYPHKSGFLKRKERKEREEEQEKIKKKNLIFHYFKKPETTQEPNVEQGESSELDMDVRSDTIEGHSQHCELLTISEDLQEEGMAAFEIQNCSTESVLPEESVSSCTQSAASIEDTSSIAYPFEILSDLETSCSSSFASSSTGPVTMDLCKVDWKDPALWPENLQDKERNQIVLSGLMTEEDLKKMAYRMTLDSDGRSFSEYLLYAKSSNGREKILRDWLRWSDSKHVLYCITCRAFSTNYYHRKNGSILCRSEGFDPSKNTWHRLYTRLPEHERSAQHRKYYLSWRALQRSIGGQGVDFEMQRKLTREAEKFAALLERLLNVTLFLASRNLAFRGCSQRIGDIQNGNFLGTLELVAKYDSVLREHLEKVKQSQEKGKRLPAHYLSSATQNELIDVCGRHVLNVMLSERQQSIYFSVICDATPDVSHMEQNVIILRYVHRDLVKRKWGIQERFLEFFDFFEKTGEEIAEMLLTRLCEHGIDVKDCRGQGYDNGANMSGKIKGVRSRIQQKYPAALFSPCAAHSLNLVGVHAASSSPEMKTFFGSVNRLYVLFSSSPERWSALLDEVGGSLHGLSDTRWSSRIEAVKPIAQKLPSVLKALERVLKSKKLTSAAHSEAEGLLDYFSSFRAIVLATFWVKVLQSFEERNKILQSRSVSIDIGAANIRALSEEMKILRDKWPALLSESKVVADSMEIPKELLNAHQLRKKKADKNVKDLDVEIYFKVNMFFPAMDVIISDLDQRFKSMEEVCKLFAPILNLRTLSEEELKTSTEMLISTYRDDFTESLLTELQLLRKIYAETFTNQLGPLELLNSIYELQLEGIFGEICIALRIFATLPLSVAEGERAFSKLALIKNYLRSTMSEQRLNSLALLSIEHELARQLNFKDLINEFAEAKVRRMSTTNL